MLARLTLLLIALPALALAANAGGDHGRTAPQPTMQHAATPPVISPPPPTVPSAPSQCRMGCAQTYYFCRAGDHPDDCSRTWGECVATCTSPDLAPSYSPAP